jgi:hypothetical protein
MVSSKEIADEVQPPLINKITYSQFLWISARITPKIIIKNEMECGLEPV